MRRDGKERAIAGLGMFRGAPKQDVAATCRLMELVAVHAGTDVCTEGARARQFAIVVTGALEADRPCGAHFTPGEQVGAAALLRGGVHATTVRAVVDGWLLVAGPREFRALVDDVPAVRHAVLMDLASRGV